MRATEAATGDVAGFVRNQLSQPTDVRAAHQYFSPGDAQAGLPNLQTFNGSESLSFSSQPINFTAAPDLALQGGQLHFTEMAAANSAQNAIGNAALLPRGMEALTAMPGADAAALASMPGGDPISPMIQIIMKLPGHIGLLNSFFEALAAFFFPSMDIFAAFNPALWMQHANAAMSSLAHFGQQLPVSLSLLPTGGQMFSNLGQNFAQMGNTMGGGMMDGAARGLGTSLPVSSEHLQLSHLSNSDLNVSGYGSMGKPLYEQGPIEYANPHEMAGSEMFDGQQMAFDGQGSSFRPTLGGMQQPSATSQVPVNNTPPAPAPNTTPHHPAPPSHAKPVGHHGASHRGSLLDHSKTPPPSDANSIAQAPPADGGSYTIKAGDNLWDIAKNHLGDGSRWQQIFDLNQSTLGNNPDLIFPGQHINMPDGSQLASAENYVVQPGDNLWDIAREKMGGGQNWPDIYKQNADVIGHDPRMIHPGQQLHLEGGSTGQLAHHAPAHHAPAHHHAPSHNVAHHAHPHAPAHHAAQAHAPQTTAHAPAPPKAVEASSQQVPRQLAETPGGAQGLKAEQQMGSLKDIDTSSAPSGTNQ